MAKDTNTVNRKGHRQGWPHGQVVKFTHSALAAWGFTSPDPRHRYGTACPAMLRWHPTQHNQRHSQLEYTTLYWEGLGRRRRRNKKKGHADVQLHLLYASQKTANKIIVRYFSLIRLKEIKTILMITLGSERC